MGCFSRNCFRSGFICNIRYSLCNGNFKGGLISFAKDTAFAYKVGNWDQVKLAVEYDLVGLKLWSGKNLMVLSLENTNFINFRLKESEKSLKIVY